MLIKKRLVDFKSMRAFNKNIVNMAVHFVRCPIFDGRQKLLYRKLRPPLPAIKLFPQTLSCRRRTGTSDVPYQEDPVQLERALPQSSILKKRTYSVDFSVRYKKQGSQTEHTTVDVPSSTIQDLKCLQDLDQLRPKDLPLTNEPDACTESSIKPPKTMTSR